ncbi:MAG: hypothetical protein BroJett030_07160 [Alphaproteobacteria bacterium]|nr:MAG: hypothetical protein BroJett030_07160 [Alphaproteobacteria bacterium]
MLVMFFIGLAIFLFLMAVAGYVVYSRYSHAQNWHHAEATVGELITLCEVEYKSGKNWRRATTLACEEADGYIEQNRSILYNSWRTTPREFARIIYEAGGRMHTQTLLRTRVSATPVAAGATVPILVDPQDAQSVDRANVATDLDLLWIMALVGAGIWALLLLIGWLVGRRPVAAPPQQAAG